QSYEKWQSPSKLTAFSKLFAQNCIACHGDGKTISASIPLNDPLYLSYIPEATMRGIIANGIPGTSMPAFAKSRGGMLTDDQVDILAGGIFSEKPKASLGTVPPYTAAPGDVVRGAQTFSVYCAACHEPAGEGLGKYGSVVDPTYLALVSNQYLRTVIVMGRPDLKMPNYRNDVSGKPMTDQDISDVVAWLASHRLPAGSSGTPVSKPSPSGVVVP
ncbi:MAG: c-type cytochrome, partial [Chthoniobacterales bacterium]